MVSSRRSLVAASSVVAVVSASFVLCSGLSAKQPKKQAPAPTFKATQAILNARCVGCHNDTRHPGGVNLSSYKAAMASGGGSVVVPGHPEKSNLVLYINGKKQPRMPMGQPPLSAHDIQVISAWIKAGAHQ